MAQVCEKKYTEMTVEERVSALIKETKEKFDYNQTTLGTRIGLSHNAVRMMEEGKIDPLSTRVMIKPHLKLAEVWGWTFEELFHYYETGQRPGEQRGRRSAEQIIQDIKDLGDKDTATYIATEALLLGRYFFLPDENRKFTRSGDNRKQLGDTSSDVIGVTDVGRVTTLIRSKLSQRGNLEESIAQFLAGFDRLELRKAEQIRQEIEQHLVNNTEIPRSRFGVVADLLSIWEQRTVRVEDLEQHVQTNCEPSNGIEV